MNGAMNFAAGNGVYVVIFSDKKNSERGEVEDFIVSSHLPSTQDVIASVASRGESLYAQLEQIFCSNHRTALKAAHAVAKMCGEAHVWERPEIGKPTFCYKVYLNGEDVFIECANGSTFTIGSEKKEG